jgi:hypothetical protein
LPGFTGPIPSTALDKRFNFLDYDYYRIKVAGLSRVNWKKAIKEVFPD